MEPAVGASVCASGSHVWTGTAGILTRKPTMNSQNTSVGAVMAALSRAIWDIDVPPSDMMRVTITPRSMTPPAANV